MELLWSILGFCSISWEAMPAATSKSLRAGVGLIRDIISDDMSRIFKSQTLTKEHMIFMVRLNLRV